MIAIKLTKANPGDFQQIATLVAGVVTAGHSANHPGVPYLKDNGGWVLNRGNDWFAHYEPTEDGVELRISYRYENADNDAAFKGLGEFLQWLLTVKFGY